jgi:diguanylate cyclase (GGDEF)-like protein/putative nucleotidyltransferase with HDIG domain
MFKIRTAARLAITFGVITASVIWFAVSIRLIPDPQKLELENRIAVTKSIALSVKAHAENRRDVKLDPLLDRTMFAYKCVRSIGVKRGGRRGYAGVRGPHAETWNIKTKNDPRKQVGVEVLSNGKLWGTVEVGFAPVENSYGFPFKIIGFIAASMALMSWLVMSRTFKYLNPSNVVPGRVRSALDTLAEGLVLVDPSGEIAHSNTAFDRIVEHEGEILGRKLDSLGWQLETSEKGKNDDKCNPWNRCFREKNRVCGDIIELSSQTQNRKFVVNATPILGKNQLLRGALVSFDDVTELEKKNFELASMIDSLRSSRDEISRQNEKLNFLASYDPLTTCMNRRAFFGKFEEIWEASPGADLTLIILDVDFFKAVNDNHGHSVGDEVLKATGQLLRDEVGDVGFVCRYGGEEFIVLIPEMTFDDCAQFADKIRQTIEVTPVGDVSFTASFGISTRKLGAMDPQHLLDQADESLYVAKRSGRNQVVKFDEIKNYDVVEEAEAPVTEMPDENRDSIAYSAVTGLLSALSFRCQSTAEHSIRVADLCVGIGASLMSSRELYLLEISALLHDIGKIGVPDAILHKPGPLTPEEWAVMEKHDDIGVEIVRSAFASDAITRAIESHHCCFSARQKGKGDAAAQSIPLAGRIITVCDAFDAMTNDRVYRAAMSHEDALRELVANSPRQFDPTVVSKLVEHVQAGLAKNHAYVRGSIDSRSAGDIGQYIEAIQNAVATEDVEALRHVVDSLKENSKQSEPVVNVASQLDDAINSPVEDMNQVLKLANEVMEICRSSRSAFVDAAESIIEK